MATHDYVIDNSTGANVRADINLVLQAILTNNSSSSAPSTTAAYMWWADTTNGVLKIRNSSNNDWVELLQLDGTLTLEDGSASTPALAFRDDLNTGIFSSAADTFNVATAGVERMELGATTIFNEDGADVDFRIEGDTDANLFYVDAGNDRVGIGRSDPQTTFHSTGTTNGQQATFGASSTGLKISTFAKTDNDAGVILDAQQSSNGTLTFATTGSERMRIDSSGDVLIGTSTSSNSKLTVFGSDAAAIFQGSSTGTGAGNGFTIGNNGGTDAFLWNYEDGFIQFATNNTEAMRIDSSGRLLLGTTTEGHANGDDLTIATSGNTGLTIRSGTSSSGNIYFSDGTSGDDEYRGFVSYGHNVDGMYFATNASTRMFIDSSGQIGIGTTSPATQLDVFKTGNVVTGRFGCDSAAAVCCDFKNTISSGTAFFARFIYTGSECGNIQASSTGSTSYNTSSDYRLKENEVEISDGITRLKTLKPYRFNWKAHPDLTVDGFFAHEVTAVPEAITGTKDEVATEDMDGLGYKKGDPIYQNIDQSKLVPLITAALKEAIGKIEVLETKVAALEAA